MMEKNILIAVASALVLALLFMATSPTTAPVFLLIVPFVACFSLLCAVLMYIGGRKGWPRTRRIRVAIVGAGVPVVMLVLQSIGQLTVRDIVTIGAIFVILYFYLSRLSFKK